MRIKKQPIYHVYLLKETVNSSIYQRMLPGNVILAILKFTHFMTKLVQDVCTTEDENNRIFV